MCHLIPLNSTSKSFEYLVGKSDYKRKSVSFQYVWCWQMGKVKLDFVYHVADLKLNVGLGWWGGVRSGV